MKTNVVIWCWECQEDVFIINPELTIDFTRKEKGYSGKCPKCYTLLFEFIEFEQQQKE
ncbi:MAG: hypothetical protein GQ540_03435 [Lutibacter sp.]|uniref:hypothetical protein n=1 Tax=Lutibacter sp. TaxID=1925666 RepID=UPI0019D9840F|nr:hypothetical protein [Lutibacter sp.]NOR27565.1 hypothetical protein [Lutibacter sp.]